MRMETLNVLVKSIIEQTFHPVIHPLSILLVIYLYFLKCRALPRGILKINNINVIIYVYLNIF